MLNKYLSKLKKDFEHTNWNEQLKNNDGSVFPEKLGDMLDIQPENDKPQTLIFFSTKKATGRISRKTPLKPSWLLPHETKITFALYLNYKLSSCNNKIARKFSQQALSALTHTTYQPHELTQSRYSDVVNSLSNQSILPRFNEFINWCIDNNYCELIRTQPSGGGGVYDGAKRNKEKLPEVSSILALGDIFCSTIPIDRTAWDTKPNSPQANALMVMYSALCLASPNRMRAEVITLPKQKLLKFCTKDKNNNETLLHSLMWQGSKHYKDNENHIGSWMVEPIERGIEYFDLVTKPYRVLTSFWLNQDSTIKELFPKIDDEIQKRLRIIKLSISDTPTFMHLGYLLGFYDTDTFELNIRGAHKSKSKVHISEVNKDFRLFFSNNCGLNVVLGLKRIRQSSSLVAHNHLKLGRFITIQTIQKAIFADMIREWPSFPDLSMGQGANKTHILQAMWCFNSYSINGCYYYKLVTASNIESLVDTKLCKGGLLKDNSYSIRLKVTPHQLRHYINHNGYINGLPDYILNMWSGREDSKHLLSYIHENEEDILARIPMVTKQIKAQNITVTSEQEYAKAKSLVSGATSRTSVGFCSKDLRYSPCSYLSKFETQCTFCEHSCHIAHDEHGIRVLKEDYQIQCEQLNTHLSSPKRNNQHQQSWYKMHKANTYLLSQLIETLVDPTIPKGSVVRILTDVQQIRIADLKTREITNKKLQLDIMDDDIQEGLKQLEYTEEKTKRDKETEDFLNDLWGDL